MLLDIVFYQLKFNGQLYFILKKYTSMKCTYFSGFEFIFYFQQFSNMGTKIHYQKHFFYRLIEGRKVYSSVRIREKDTLLEKMLINLLYLLFL